MVAGGERGFAGKRDRALLLAFPLAARRSEPVALDLSKLTRNQTSITTAMLIEKTNRNKGPHLRSAADASIGRSDQMLSVRPKTS
jgi:hypothetical protein